MSKTNDEYKKNMGRTGENIACLYLQKKGYKILKRNYHTRYGEIDIIAQKENIVAFVEVKLRVSNGKRSVNPKIAVDKNKQRKLVKSAIIYLSKVVTEAYPRFDVVEVVVKDNRFFANHIKSAFSLEDSEYEIF